jgi:hypothetical protein
MDRMSKKMQMGKTYRLRRKGASTFEPGYFFDFCFYGSEHSMILGHVDAMGRYIGRVPVHSQYGNPHKMQGRIVDLILECIDGQSFELIKID